MRLQHLLYILLFSSLCISCLVPPASSYRVVVPEETLMRYRKFIPSDERITYKSYQTVVTELPDGSFKERTFYPEKYQCTFEITYTDKSFTTKNGSYKEWWDDGDKKTDGQYTDGDKVGKWKYYNLKDGMLSLEVDYKDDKKNGEEIIYRDEKIKATYNYRNGIKEGEFIIFDSMGVVTNEGIYKADTIFSQSLVVVDVDMDKSKVAKEMPMFDPCLEESDIEARKACAQKKMLVYIYSNIKYPADAREKDIEGTALIRYVVDKDGSIKDITVLRGICSSIEAECVRLVSEMPQWTPGKQGGEPVKVQFNLPIKFKLQ